MMQTRRRTDGCRDKETNWREEYFGTFLSSTWRRQDFYSISLVVQTSYLYYDDVFRPDFYSILFFLAFFLLCFPQSTHFSFSSTVSLLRLLLVFQSLFWFLRSSVYFFFMACLFPSLMIWQRRLLLLLLWQQHLFSSNCYI